MGQLGEAGNKMHATTPEKVSLLDGCDVWILVLHKFRPTWRTRLLVWFWASGSSRARSGAGVGMVSYVRIRES